MKRVEITENFYSSKALLKRVGRLICYEIFSHLHTPLLVCETRNILDCVKCVWREATNTETFIVNFFCFHLQYWEALYDATDEITQFKN